MQLQGTVFIQLQGNDILVNCQEYIYIFTKSMINRGNYILSQNYIYFKELISSFKEYVLVQGKHIHSGKLYPCVRGHSRNIYSKIVPSHFMINISFTITISWMKYSNNSSVEGWRNCWFDRRFRIIIAVRVVLLRPMIVRRNATRIAARFRHCIFATTKLWYAHQRAVYI